MKLQVQRHLDLSQMRISQMSNPFNESRMLEKRKITHKYQELKKRESRKLKEIVEREKVHEIKKEFIHKLKLLIPHRNIPQELLAFRKEPTNFLGLFLLKLQQKEGFKVGPVYHLIWKVIILINIAMLLLASSFQLAFNEAQLSYKLTNLIKISILINVADILANLMFQKFQKNKNVKNIMNIAESYAKNDLTLDVFSLLLSIGVLLISDDIMITLLIVFTILKLWRTIYKIEVLQHVYIVNVFHQKYYTILRVFLFNFTIAHFIAITVILMAKINDQLNWIKENQLENAGWIEKYTWAYYWAVNIMLTVGFGDITATNKDEALVLIFVETISCIMLAYNINIVGSILTDIKEKERDRKNQLRVLLKMARENQIESSIVEQAINYVDESFKIKQRFSYEDHDCIMQTLPQSLQSEYCKEINKKMMFDLPLVQFFSCKSLLKVGECVIRKLAHPQEIVWKKGQQFRLIILNKGKVGLTVRQNSSLLNGQVMQTLQVHSNKSKLVTMNFLKNQRLKYDIKSINYSVIYHLSTQQFAAALSERQTDYEIFCALRDKGDTRLDSGELYQCRFCPGNRHDYFNCPKMHLVLIKGHTILKSLLNVRKNRNDRFQFIRQFQSRRFLKLCKTIKNEQESYINLASQCRRDTNSTIQSAKEKSEKIITSIHSNLPMSNVFREFDIQRLNSLVVGKLNEHKLCFGFWNVECDVGFNFNSYFRAHNAENLKDKDFGYNRVRLRSHSYNSGQEPSK